MAYSYPIWNDVETYDAYKGSKSYGARDTSSTRVYVGTSARNSELLVEHATTRHIRGDYTVFRFVVDTGRGLEVVARKWMHNKTREWFDTEPAELREVAA